MCGVLVHLSFSDLKRFSFDLLDRSIRFLNIVSEPSPFVVQSENTFGGHIQDSLFFVLFRSKSLSGLSIYHRTLHYNLVVSVSKLGSFYA